MLTFLRPHDQLGMAPSNVTGLTAFVESVKPVLPIPVVALAVWVLWRMFRGTWRSLDEDSHRFRGEMLAKGEMDRRPIVALVLCALILAMQEYYGGRAYFELKLHPILTSFDAKHGGLKLLKYDELYGFAWWGGTRIFGYVLPFVVWKFFFRQDSVRDFGLRTKGFFDHVWIYGLYFLAVVPGMLIVSSSPDFGAYYPFYKMAQRSWFDFLTWEAIYFVQFFALEMFFRGFWLGALRRSFGSGAIFVMAVPYCMIHFGKPYLEACGAILAGIALGSLSMKTKSIYQGFLIHITVAGLMDWLSLRRRHCTPLTFWPPEAPMGCTEQADLRDGLARSIEHVAAPVFLLLVAVAVFFFVRQRRSRVSLI